MKMIAQNPYFVRVSRLGNLSSPPLASLVGEPPIKVVSGIFEVFFVAKFEKDDIYVRYWDLGGFL